MVSRLSVLQKLQVRGKSWEIKCEWVRRVWPILRLVTIFSSLHDFRFDEDCLSKPKMLRLYRSRCFDSTEKLVSYSDENMFRSFWQKWSKISSDHVKRVLSSTIEWKKEFSFFHNPKEYYLITLLYRYFHSIAFSIEILAYREYHIYMLPSNCIIRHSIKRLRISLTVKWAILVCVIL